MRRHSYSSISDAFTCWRKYYYAWVLRRRPTGGAGRSLSFGRAFHEAQAAWWGASGDPAQRMLAAMEAWEQSSVGLSLDDRIIGETLLVGYAAHWSDAAYRYQMTPVVERKAETPLLGPDGKPIPGVTLVMVVDALAHASDGKTVLIEHKTTRSDVTPGSRYWDRIERSLQADMYHLMAADMGYRVDYVLWDVVRVPEFTRLPTTPPERREFYVKSGPWGKKGDPKPNTRLTEETPEEFAARVTQVILDNPAAYFARKQLYRSERELDAVRADLWGTDQLVKAALDTGAFPRNTDSCSKYGVDCQYVPVCFGGADINDDQLYTIRTHETPDPWDSD